MMIKLFEIIDGTKHEARVNPALIETYWPDGDNTAIQFTSGAIRTYEVTAHNFDYDMLLWEQGNNTTPDEVREQRMRQGVTVDQLRQWSQNDADDLLWPSTTSYGDA